MVPREDQGMRSRWSLSQVLETNGQARRWGGEEGTPGKVICAQAQRDDTRWDLNSALCK